MMSNKDESRWQSSLSCSLERLSYLRNTGALSDITITFPGHPHVIKGHRMILAMSSPVFEAMLYGPLAEGDRLTLHEDCPEAFTWLMDYIYSDNNTLNDVNLAIQVYYLASKYYMDSLTKNCSKFLRQHVTGDTALQLCEVALMLQDDELLAHVIQILETCSDEILLSPNLPFVSASTLLHLLTHLPLAPSSEVIVFRALLRWGEQRLAEKEDCDSDNSEERFKSQESAVSSATVAGKDDINTRNKEQEIQKIGKAESSEKMTRKPEINTINNEREIPKTGKSAKKYAVEKFDVDSLQHVQDTVARVCFNDKKDKDSNRERQSSKSEFGNPRTLKKSPEQSYNKSLREVLCDFLPHIRFLSMTSDQFLEHVMPSGVFTSEEGMAILMNIKNISTFPLSQSITSKNRKPRMETQSASLVHCQAHSTPQNQEILRDFRVSHTVFLVQVTAPGVVALEDAELCIRNESGGLIGRGKWKGVGCKFDFAIRLECQECYRMVVSKAYGSCEGCGCDSYKSLNDVLFCGKALAYTPVFLEFWRPQLNE